MSSSNLSALMLPPEYSEEKHMANANTDSHQPYLHQMQSSSRGPVAILWDIENCPVPSDVCSEDVAGNIRMALRAHPVIDGVVTTFSAYGDFNAFPRRLREGCQRTGVKLIDIPNGRKDAADKAILVDVFLFALDYRPPSTILLISGDVDFAPALHVLGQRGYTIILVIPSKVSVSSALINSGQFVWDWPSVARGEGFVPPAKVLLPPCVLPTNINGFLTGCEINDNLDCRNEEEAIVYSCNKRDFSLISQSPSEYNISSTSTSMHCYPTSSRSHGEMAPPTHTNLMRDLLPAVQELSRQNPPPPQNAPPQQNAPQIVPGVVSVVEQFRRYKPPTFDGGSDPLVVEEWIRSLERIFRHIACSDAQKVLCAEFMFVGAASHWWESVSRTGTEQEQRNLTWEQFKDDVLSKYFPQALRDFKESEFLQLRQGNMSLTDYERQFDQLSRYAPHLVDTEVKKIRRFENGLRPKIGKIIMSHRFTSYREMLERAHAISYQRTTFEQYAQQSKESGGKRKWNNHGKDKRNLQNKRPNTGVHTGGMSGNITPCPKCDKLHKGECLFGKNVCFRCGKPGHFVYNCTEPPKKRDEDQDNNKKGKARVFALNQHEAEQDPNVIAD